MTSMIEILIILNDCPIILNNNIFTETMEELELLLELIITNTIFLEMNNILKNLFYAVG